MSLFRKFRMNRKFTTKTLVLILTVALYLIAPIRISILSSEDNPKQIVAPPKFKETKRVTDHAIDAKSIDKTIWFKAAVCVQYGDDEKLEELLNADPSLARMTDNDQLKNTLLHHACIYDQTSAIKILIKHGADVLARTGLPWNETPLHVAARRDSVGAVELLLDSGVDIDIQGEGPLVPPNPVIPLPYASPLDLAAAAGSEQVVELLLDRGAKINVNPAKSTYTALHRAMEGKYNFLGYGDMKRCENKKLRASRGNREIIEMLLDKGADLKSKDFFENTPFHIAVLCGAYESVDYLLNDQDEAIDVESLGQFGFTPLQLAVDKLPRDGQQNTIRVIELLLKKGADKSKIGGPSNPMVTAYQYAKEQAALGVTNWGEPVLKILQP